MIVRPSPCMGTAGRNGKSSLAVRSTIQVSSPMVHTCACSSAVSAGSRNESVRSDGGGRCDPTP